MRTGVDEIEHAPVRGALTPGGHQLARRLMLCKSLHDVLLPNLLSTIERIDERPGEHSVRGRGRGELSVDKIL